MIDVEIIAIYVRYLDHQNKVIYDDEHYCPRPENLSFKNSSKLKNYAYREMDVREVINHKNAHTAITTVVAIEGNYIFNY